MTENPWLEMYRPKIEITQSDGSIGLEKEEMTPLKQEGAIGTARMR